MDSCASQGTYSKDTQGRYVGSAAGESLCEGNSGKAEEKTAVWVGQLM